MQHDHAPSKASARTGDQAAVPSFEPVPELPVVYCPECGMPAWVEWRDAVGSTAGAVVHVKVRCFARHWFLMPEDRLTAA
jgi:hypothetical protein